MKADDYLQNTTATSAIRYEPGNRWEYKKSRHFWRLSFVELRGIEPRSDDRTLSLLRA